MLVHWVALVSVVKLIGFIVRVLVVEEPPESLLFTASTFDGLLIYSHVLCATALVKGAHALPF
jgi:hypothetical protein